MDTTFRNPNLGSSKKSPTINFQIPHNTYNIIIAQQSLPQNKYQYIFPVFDVTKKFEESLQKCREKNNKRLKIKAIEKVNISKTLSQNLIENYKRANSMPGNIKHENFPEIKVRERCVSMTETNDSLKSRRASELVDQLLLDIYGRGNYPNENLGGKFDTEYGSSTSFKSIPEKFDEKMQYSRLLTKDISELRMLITALRDRITYTGNLLVKQLKKKDALRSKQEKICNVITAHLHAFSHKKSEDTNMRFSPNPAPGDSGFNQWQDAMKMVAKLPGGIPPEFRKKLWIALAEKHLQSRGVNWNQTEKLCFNEWSNPDDSELGIQIVKDLHRTGCSLFCGAAGQENQALLKRVLLAYARWNKSVGYCQGFNMLAALILQVMDRNETDSVKVMIYLIEGVLPESYFANNLRGLSVDMIVFRDLLRIRLPQLSKHLEALQNDAREGNSYEPPLTNVFTMQWFLTLFCNCLPQATVLRVWDLIFLEGNEILLRTAIAIWQKLSDRILAVNSADEFYSIMGVLTREMLEFGLVDSNTLIKTIVEIGTCNELNEMRDKYLYNITPWTQSVQTAARKGFKLFYSDDDETESDYDEKAAVTAAYGINIGRKRDKNQQNSKESNVIQPYAHGHPDRERLALDISALKKQYAKLRERQRQAHIILQAACARQPMGQNSSPSPIAMNHLLLGKNAIVNSRGRRLGPPKGSIPPARTKPIVKKKETAPVITGETIHWKDTEKFRRRQSVSEDTESSETFIPDSDSSSYSEDDDDASSTSTELCDEDNNRLSDFEEKTSNILEAKVGSIKNINSDVSEETSKLHEIKISEKIQSDIKNLVRDIDKLKTSDDFVKTGDTSDLKIDEVATNNDEPNLETLIRLSSEVNEPNLIEIPDTPNENTNITPENENITLEENLQITSETTVTSPDVTTCGNLATKHDTNTEEILSQNEEDIFESFLQERVKLSKENSVESITSPTEEPHSLKPSEDKLRRHKSYEETPKNHFEKSFFKQASFDTNIVPTIETSLWKPYQIEEEAEDVQKTEFLQDCVKLSRENSLENITSPTEEPHNLKPSEDKLRRHKSYEETPKSNSEKSFFKQASFDTNVVPTIETSLWTPYQIEEEVEEIQQPETQHEKVKKQTSVDLLTVEDKRLEAGRRNSERALKIIQENSLILHRILLQQKSSDPDSEDETSRSPISKTFLRSESLLSKDEKTDEDRSSRDGDEELESGVESFSVSPAHLEEENDRSLKKEFEDETLIISKNIEGNTEVQYKYNYQTNEEKVQTGEDNLLASSEEINISPLTQNENNITSVSEINKNINISKNDVRETSNIQTDIVPSSKFIISPVISEDETSSLPINAINNFNQYTYATNDFKQPTSFLVSKEFSISPSTPDEKISSSVEPSFYNREDTQNIEEKSSITLPTSAYYNLSPIMPDEKNSSCILESATKNSEILSDSERNPNATSDFQDLTDFKLNISLFSKSDKYNLSPLTPNEKKIDIKTTGHEETPNLKPNCVFSSSIQYNLSPITPNEKNYLVETTNNKQLPDLQTKNMFSSSVQYNLSLVTPEEENIAFKTTAKEDLPNISDFSNLIHYNLSSITPDGKNVTNEATSDKEMSDFKSNKCMISPLIDEKTNKESPDSKTNIMFPNNLSPETPDGKNIAVKTTGREESSNSKSNISVFSNSIQYNLSPLTPDEKKATNEIMLADISIMEKPKDINLSSTFKQYTSLITPEEPNASNLESLKNLELNTEELPNYQNISSFSNSKYFAAITPENDSRLKPNLTESPDIQNNTSSMSLPKYFSILPITPTDTNILSSQQTKVFDDTSKTDDHKEQYSIFPITPTNTNASNFVSSPDKIGHCNDFKKSSDKPTFSNQFTVSSVSPEVAPDTSNDRNITTYSTNIDDKSRLEIHSNIENISYKNIVTPDDISYKFSYKSSDVTKDSKKLESDSSEKSFSTSPVASKREEKSPDYLAYYKSDKLADSKETKSLFEELKDEIQFKIEETPKEASPYKYKYREDSDDSITEIRNRITAQRQNDNTALPTSTQYNFDSPIDSTENFSTKTDEATNYQPEDSKFNYKFSLESPEYYAKSNLPEPDLKPSIYSPDDVLSKTTDDSVSMPTKHIVKPFVYSPEDTTSTKDFDSTFRSKTQDFETKSDNNSVSSGQETKYDRTKLTIDLKPNKYNDISPEISPPKHLSCLQFTSFQADIPCTSKAIQFSPICAKEKSISPKSPKSPKYLLNLPTLSPPRRTLKSPSSPNRNFSPFPVQPIARQPKELGVKLGLYKDLNSPNK